MEKFHYWKQQTFLPTHKGLYCTDSMENTSRRRENLGEE